MGNSFLYSRALVSVATYPILQWAFRDDPIKREAIPQLTYSCEGKRTFTYYNLLFNTVYQ